jgi:hypothetical protein
MGEALNVRSWWQLEAAEKRRQEEEAAAEAARQEAERKRVAKEAWRKKRIEEIAQGRERIRMAKVPTLTLPRGVGCAARCQVARWVRLTEQWWRTTGCLHGRPVGDIQGGGGPQRTGQAEAGEDGIPGGSGAVEEEERDGPSGAFVSGPTVSRIRTRP